VDSGETPDLYPTRVNLIVNDRAGLLRDIAEAVSEERVNVGSLITQDLVDGRIAIELTLQATELDRLEVLIAKLEGIRSVNEVTSS